MQNESSISRPVLKSIRRSEGVLSIDLEFRGRDVTLINKVVDRRKELQKVFTDDLVDIILGDAQIPDGERDNILSRISEQYRQRVSKKLAKKSLE